MFQREEHRAVLRVLGALDADLLDRHHVCFGGGTRLVLELGEYRLSHDVDFLCCDVRAFAELRTLARQGGPESLFEQGSLTGIEFPREMRADQYGVRFPIVAGGVPIKFELISEGRIELEPAIRPPWSPVGCLTLADAYAEKLLSNSDRWPDRNLLARDVIDLGMLRAEAGPIPGEAWSKAERAYGSQVRRDLRKALAALLEDPAFQSRCFAGLTVSRPRKILDGATQLLSDLNDGAA